MSKSITDADSEIIIKELCKRVDKKPEDINFKKKDWFRDYSWTKQEEDDFIRWLADFLRKNKYVILKRYRGQDAAINEASKIVANYGWVVKEGKQIV